MLRSRKLAIDILNEFEELLAVYNIKIPDSNRSGADDEACLYGDTYYWLEDKITDLIERAWIGEVIL